jgi:hypothetical protein
MNTVDIDIAGRIKDLGFDIPYSYVYASVQDINDEVREKHGELSDCGFYELTKEGGGDYDWNYVYVNKIKLVHVFDRYHHNELVAAPFVEDVLKYFRDEKDIVVNVIYNVSEPDSSERYQATIIDFSDKNYPKVHRPVECAGISSYETAEDRAIEYILFKLFK